MTWLNGHMLQDYQGCPLLAGASISAMNASDCNYYVALLMEMFLEGKIGQSFDGSVDDLMMWDFALPDVLIAMMIESPSWALTLSSENYISFTAGNFGSDSGVDSVPTEG